MNVTWSRSTQLPIINDSAMGSEGLLCGWELETVGDRSWPNQPVRPNADSKRILKATRLLISGEAETARVILRDLVNATLGFEQLAKLTDVPSKSLHRMLSPKGNPSMDNLAAIFGAVSSKISRSARGTRQRNVA
jgi:DNA-binding phage protein